MYKYETNGRFDRLWYDGDPDNRDMDVSRACKHATTDSEPDVWLDN